MNRKRSAVLAAVAIAAPLVTFVSTSASAAPGQFCQENCYNSGYRYVKEASVSGSDFEDGESFPVVAGTDGPVRPAGVGPFGVDADPQTLRFFCDGPGSSVRSTGDLDLDERDLIDSLDADQATASLNAAASLLTAGGDLTISPRILTDSRGRPVGLSARFDDTDPDFDLEEIDGFEFQLVCLDDRDPVSP